MTKFSRPKTENAISVKDQVQFSKGLYQLITAIEHWSFVEYSVPSATADSVISAMMPTLSKEQQSILEEIRDSMLQKRNQKERDWQRAENEYLEQKYASLLRELGERKAND